MYKHHTIELDEKVVNSMCQIVFDTLSKSIAEHLGADCDRNLGQTYIQAAFAKCSALPIVQYFPPEKRNHALNLHTINVKNYIDGLK